MLPTRPKNGEEFLGGTILSFLLGISEIRCYRKMLSLVRTDMYKWMGYLAFVALAEDKSSRIEVEVEITMSLNSPEGSHGSKEA